VRFELAPRTILLLLATAFAVWLLIGLLPVLFVLVVALFLVGTLGPFVELLERRGVKRPYGIAIVFTALLALVVAVGGVTLPSLVTQAGHLLEQAPGFKEKTAAFFARSRFTAPLADSIRNFHGPSKDVAASALAFSAGAAERIGYAVSSVFLALYLMIDRDRVRGGLFAMVPRRHHVRLSRVILKLEEIVGGYIRGQLITSALMAVFTFVLLALARVESALALAVFAGVADVLPYVGVFLSVGPAVLATLSGSVVWTLVVLVAMLGYEELESRYIVPKVYGNALRLPSSMVILALLAGGTIGGILGALFALPVAAAIRMLMEEFKLQLPGEAVTDADDAVRAREQHAQTEYEARSDGKGSTEAAAIAFEIADRAA